MTDQPANAEMTTEERIRARAYTLWEAAGHSHGNHELHWLQAVLEIAAEGVSGKAAASRPAGKVKTAANKGSTRKKAA